MFWKYTVNLWVHACSPVNLLHIFRTHFPKNTSGGLFLYIFIWVVNSSLDRSLSPNSVVRDCKCGSRAATTPKMESFVTSPKSTIQTPERHHWHYSVATIANPVPISHPAVTKSLQSLQSHPFHLLILFLKSWRPFKFLIANGAICQTFEAKNLIELSQYVQLFTEFLKKIRLSS